MKTLAEIQTILTQTKPELQEKYQIRQIGIFGSYVRGEQNQDSDLDILVEFDSEFRFGLLTFCEIENYLSEILEIPVDLVTKDGLKPQIGKQILQEVVSL